MQVSSRADPQPCIHTSSRCSPARPTLVRRRLIRRSDRRQTNAAFTPSRNRAPPHHRPPLRPSQAAILSRARVNQRYPSVSPRTGSRVPDGPTRVASPPSRPKERGRSCPTLRRPRDSDQDREQHDGATCEPCRRSAAPLGTGRRDHAVAVEKPGTAGCSAEGEHLWR